MKNSIKVIFFDAAGTLIHLVEPVGRTYARIAKGLGETSSEEVFEESFFEAWKKMPARVLNPNTREEDDKLWWRDLVFKMLSQMEITLNQVVFFDEVYRYFAKPEAWKLFEEVDIVLESLQREGFRLGVISNFDSRLFHLLDSYNVSHRMERIIVSSQVGMEKPQPEIFHYALQAFGIEAGEALHVGDHAQEDYAGARAAGLQAFLVQRPRVDLKKVLEQL